MTQGTSASIRLAHFWGLRLVGAALTLSCGNAADRSGRSPGEPIPPLDFVEELSSAVCANLGDCCTAQDFVHDVDTCAVALGQLYGTLAQGAIEDERYDPDVGGDCVDRLVADTLACNFSRFGGDACGTLFDTSSAHRREEGEACGNSCQDTASGATCWVVSEDPGECHLQDGLFCDPLSERCGIRSPLGGSCTTSHGCSEARCDAGECVALLEAGEDCGFDDQACAAGLRCDYTKGCVAKAELGEPCAFPEDCISSACAREKCVDPDEAGGADHAFLEFACGG